MTETTPFQVWLDPSAPRPPQRRRDARNAAIVAAYRGGLTNTVALRRRFDCSAYLIHMALRGAGIRRTTGPTRPQIPVVGPRPPQPSFRPPPLPPPLANLVVQDPDGRIRNPARGRAFNVVSPWPDGR